MRSSTKRRAALAAVILALSVAGPARALDRERTITQYVLESWTTKDGAPAGTIAGITQTRDGYLWLGTEGDGLLRFDGDTFTREAGLDALFGSPADRITSILCARDGSLWVGTTQGLARRRDGRWTVFDRGEAKDVSGLHEAGDGSVWYARHWEGLYRVANDTLTALPLGGKPRFLTSERDGTLWAGGYEGLWRLRGGKRQLFTKADGLADGNVSQLYTDREGNVWVAEQLGLTLLRGGRAVSHVTSRDGLSNEEVSAVLEDREGNFWVGTANGGLNRRRGARFESLTKALGLTSNHVTALFEDVEGSLWIGTAAGLNRLRDGNLLPFGETEGLSSRQPVSAVAGADGRAYVAAGFGGVNRIGRDAVDVLPPLARPDANFDGALYADPDGGIWTAHRGGVTYRGPGGVRVYPVTGAAVCLARDRSSLVVASVTGEVFRLVGGHFEPFRLADGSPLGPATFGADYVWMMHGARDGTLWLATSRGAITVRDGVARRPWHQGTLSARSIFEDERGVVWLGTMAGVVRVRGEQVSVFTTTQGLAENDVYTILGDGAGSLWLSGARGIFRASRSAVEDVAAGRSPRFAVEGFGVLDGMRSAVAAAPFQPSGCATPDGRLWFVTGSGIVMVDPARIRRNATPPPVLIEAVLADGRPAGGRPGPTVGPGVDRVAIHYNGLSLAVPTRVRFAYRLDGYDADWVDAANRRVAYYTKLPPGRYTFRVRAANNDGVWNEAGASIALTVKPPFWATPGFRIAAAALVLAAAVLAYRWRIDRAEEQARELAEKVAERTTELAVVQDKLLQEERLAVLGRITATVGHELRNPLANIRGSLFVLDEILKDAPPRARKALERAERNIVRCDGIVEELLDYARRRSLQLVRVEVDPWLAGVAEDVSVPGGVELRQSFGSGSTADIEPDRLFRCVANLVANAADSIAGQPRGGPLRGSFVEIASRVADGRVEILVRDDGPGIPEEARARLFEPFYSTKNAGLGLGLPLVQRIMEQHSGGIGFESGPGHTVFTLWLPVASGRAPGPRPDAALQEPA